MGCCHISPSVFRLEPESIVEILLDHIKPFAVIAGANPSGEYCRNPGSKSTELFGIRFALKKMEGRAGENDSRC
jgi:hypothetical protein